MIFCEFNCFVQGLNYKIDVFQGSIKAHKSNSENFSSSWSETSGNFYVPSLKKENKLNFATEICRLRIKFEKYFSIVLWMIIRGSTPWGILIAVTVVSRFSGFLTKNSKFLSWSFLWSLSLAVACLFHEASKPSATKTASASRNP